MHFLLVADVEINLLRSCVVWLICFINRLQSLHRAKPQAQTKIMSVFDGLIESHPLLPLISVLIAISMSEKFDSVLIKRLSYELIKMPVEQGRNLLQDGNALIVDRAIKLIAKKYLKSFAIILQNLLTAEEAFKVLMAANEPFKKTRRRLPPNAENDLTEWLKTNAKHPYMSETDVEEFCERYEGAIEGDQIRIFLTNARRKMSEGVRKRSKSK